VLEALMTSKRSSDIGFTLVELLITIALIAVVLALAAPSFTSTLANKRMEGVAGEFVTDLQYTRSEAVQRNANVRLSTGSAGSCYTIYVWTGAGSCTCTGTPGSACTGGPTELKTVQFGSSGAAVTPSVTFEFEPVRGALQGGVDQSATVSSSSGAWQLRADVLGVVGRVLTCSPSGSLKGYVSC
jgi:type IV fimbrial biogenesis protein FimT